MTILENETMKSMITLSKKVPDMTMRDIFAMHALTITKAEGDYVKAAEEAYKIADAMLAARVHD